METHQLPAIRRVFPNRTTQEASWPRQPERSLKELRRRDSDSCSQGKMTIEVKAARGDTIPPDPSADCPVCYEAFSDVRCVHCRRCSKLFHRSCVGRWGSSCPLCRDDGQFCDLACEFPRPAAQFHYVPDLLESLPSLGDSLDSMPSLTDSMPDVGEFFQDGSNEFGSWQIRNTNNYRHSARSPRGVDLSRLLPIGTASLQNVRASEDTRPPRADADPDSPYSPSWPAYNPPSTEHTQHYAPTSPLYNPPNPEHYATWPLRAS